MLPQGTDAEQHTHIKRIDKPILTSLKIAWSLSGLCRVTWRLCLLFRLQASLRGSIKLTRAGKLGSDLDKRASSTDACLAPAMLLKFFALPWSAAEGA